MHLWRRCSTLPFSLPHSPYSISFLSIGCSTLSFESSEFSSRMLSKINRTRNLTIHVNVICSLWKKKGKGRGFFSTLFQFHTAISGKLSKEEIRSWKFIFFSRWWIENKLFDKARRISSVTSKLFRTLHTMFSIKLLIEACVVNFLFILYLFD